MVQEELRCIRVFEMDELLIKAAEDVLSYEFQIGNEETNDQLTNSSFYVVKPLLSEITQNGV